MERLRGTAAPIGVGPSARGGGVLPKRRSLPMERMRGMAAPKGAGPQAEGTASPAQAVVGGAYT